MKIGYNHLELPEGKVKYKDEKLAALAAKHSPKKVSPFYVEFLKEDFASADAILMPEDSMLDLLILDMEKCEARLERSEDEVEKRLMEKCIAKMEEEIPLCDVEFSSGEHEMLRKLGLFSYKPVIPVNGCSDKNELIREALRKAGVIFFYTAGPREVHAWPVPRGTDIVTCAGKIHSDLARGFIKGDVVSYEDYVKCHNFNDCTNQGVAKVVDRDYQVEDGNIIEIRFNV